MRWILDSLREFFRKGDVVLLVLCLAASLFGLVLIFSATRWNDDNRSVVVQSIAICLGVALYIILSFVDIELFTEKAWKWMLLFNVFIILLLLTPFGVGDETGNVNWLAFPFLPMNIQPAEVAKIFFVLVLSWQCVKYREWGISRPLPVLLLAGHTLFMCGLIAAVSGDFGMVLVYLFLFVIIAWTAGVKKRWFALGGAAMVGGVALIWPYLVEHKGYITRRFTVVIDHLLGNQETIWEQTQGQGWQQSRSILAIGSGGLTGQGYLQGVQTQSLYEESLPARWTDEIFAVCGEEFGLIGCLLLIALLTAIILRCIWVARHASSPMSALTAMGFAGMLILQTVFNIGMCLYVFPVVGLTLPFISYGGSSILTLYAAMGLVSGVKMRSLPSWLRD